MWNIKRLIFKVSSVALNLLKLTKVMEFIPSSKSNKQLLVLDGHIYSQQKKLAGNIILWDCINRRKANSSNAKIKTLNGVLQGRLHQHTHRADPEKIELMKVRGAMKQRAQTTMEKTRDILSGAVACHNEAVLSRLPKESTIKRHIRISRQKANAIPPVPRPNDLQFLVPQAYCVTKDGDPFLQVDSYAYATRLLIFGTQKSMGFLGTTDHWYMDGTFDSVPPQFQQLYTIHGIKNGRNIVGCYALLTNKDTVTYERLFRHVQFFAGGANPVTLNIDFERAAMNACETVFPAVSSKLLFLPLKPKHLQESPGKPFAKCVRRRK